MRSIHAAANSMDKGIPSVRFRISATCVACSGNSSWSSIDYLGRWKALHYYALRFYRDVLFSPHAENGQIDSYVVSDWSGATRAHRNISLMDFEGHTLTSMGKDVEVAALQSRSYFRVYESELLRGQDRSKVFISCELLVEGKAVSSNELFFQPYKDLGLPKAQISTSIKRAGRGFKIALTTDRFAKAA